MVNDKLLIDKNVNPLAVLIPTQLWCWWMYRFSLVNRWTFNSWSMYKFS